MPNITRSSVIGAMVVAVIILIIILLIATSIWNKDRAMTTLAREYARGFWRATSENCLIRGCADAFVYIGRDENLPPNELSGMSVIVRANDHAQYDDSLPDGLFRLVITSFSGEQCGNARIIFDEDQTYDIKIVTDLASGRMTWIIARDGEDSRIIWEKNNGVSSMLADS